jgi:hypothetical protein
MPRVCDIPRNPVRPQRKGRDRLHACLQLVPWCTRCGDRPPSRPDYHLCSQCWPIRLAEICADIKAAREAKADGT